MSLFSQINYCEKKALDIAVTETLSIRATLLGGARPGKNLVITAGVHGAEYVGIQAALELIEELATTEFAGKILIIPVVNPTGFYESAKEVVPETGVNLNRIFPGLATGTMAERLAHTITTMIYGDADFLVDLHGGDTHESLTPLVFYPMTATGEINKLVADVCDHVTTNYKVPGGSTTSLYGNAAQHGVPAIILERGCEGKWTHAEVAACKQNIYEIMDYLEMKPYQQTVHPPQAILEGEYVQAEFVGFWYTDKTIEAPVEKGEIIGVMKNIDGVIIKTIYAKFSGIVLYKTNSLGVKPGDSLIVYGRTR